MITRLLAFSTFVLVCFVLISTPSHSQPQPVIIGHPACLSGKYAKIGTDVVAGIKACIDWTNETQGGVTIDDQPHKLEYIIYDCKSDKDQITKLMDQLMFKDKADVIFAPYSSGLTSRGAPIAESHRRLYMVHGGANNAIFEQGYNFLVQTIGPASQYHHGVLEMAREIDPQAQRVALLYQDDEFALTVMGGTLKHARQLGYEVVYKQTYPHGATRLTPLLSEMARTNPDLVLGGGHFRDGVIFCRQFSEIDFSPKALSLLVAAASPDFYHQLGSKAEGVLCPSHWEYGIAYSEQLAQEEGLLWIGPDQDEFVQRFKAHADDEHMPGYHPAEAGAQVLAYALGVERAGSTDPLKVRAALGELTFFSFYGRWDIDETGLQVGHNMIDIQWQDGQRVIVWPQKAQTAPPMYPLPVAGENREQ